MAKVMISLPDDFLKRIDRLAKTQHRSRSELIRESLRTLLEKRNDRRTSWQKALVPLRDLEQHWIGQWDSADLVRYHREIRHGREDRR
jgi:Arc/MetJ-type ribon-helix-helix transcriptional regulator